MSGITTKKCAKCGVEKSLDQFFRKTARPDGLSCSCKECEKGHPVIPRDAWKTRNERMCTKCEMVKSIDQFHFRSAKHTIRFPWCKVCHPKEETTPEVTRRRKLQYKYGISTDEYDRLFMEQNGVCLICKSPPKEGRRLSVDHDHETGLVRGLLCQPCNLGLGSFRDNPIRLMAALTYLGDHYALV
jgi:hypothetical protein